MSSTKFKLQRSGMIDRHHRGGIRDAPLELISFVVLGCYKHGAPLELTRENKLGLVLHGDAKHGGLR